MKCALHSLLLNVQGKVDDHRRKWDRSEFEKLARERLAAEEKEVKSSSSRDIGRREPTIKRDLLKPRDYKVILFFWYNIVLNVTVRLGLESWTFCGLRYRDKVHDDIVKCYYSH